MAVLNASVAGFNANCYVTIKEANAYFADRYDSDSWFDLSENDKEALLIRAARNLEQANYFGNKYYDNQSMSFPRDDHEVVEGNCASPDINKFKNTSLKSDTYGEIPRQYWKHGTIHFTSGTPVNDIVYIASSDVTKGFVYPDGGSFSAAPTTNTKFTAFAPIDKDIKSANCEEAIHIYNNDFENYAELRALGINSIRIGDFSLSPRGVGDKLLGRVPVLSVRAKKLMSRFFRKGLSIQRA